MRQSPIDAHSLNWRPMRLEELSANSMFLSSDVLARSTSSAVGAWAATDSTTLVRIAFALSSEPSSLTSANDNNTPGSFSWKAKDPMFAAFFCSTRAL